MLRDRSTSASPPSPALVDVVNYLFDETQALIPCDRMSFAFVEEDGRRVTSYFTRAAYEPISAAQGLLGGPARQLAAARAA